MALVGAVALGQREGDQASPANCYACNTFQPSSLKQATTNRDSSRALRWCLVTGMGACL